MRKIKRDRRPDFSRWIFLEPEMAINMAHIAAIVFAGEGEDAIALQFQGEAQPRVLRDPGRLKTTVLIRFLLDHGACQGMDIGEAEMTGQQKEEES